MISGTFGIIFSDALLFVLGHDVAGVILPFKLAQLQHFFL